MALFVATVAWAFTSLAIVDARSPIAPWRAADDVDDYYDYDAKTNSDAMISTGAADFSRMLEGLITGEGEGEGSFEPVPPTPVPPTSSPVTPTPPTSAPQQAGTSQTFEVQVVAKASDFDEDAFKAAFANATGIKEGGNVTVTYTFAFTLTASYSIPKEVTQKECVDLMADVYGAPHESITCDVYAVGEDSKRRLAEGQSAYALDVVVRSQEQDLVKAAESRSGNTQVVISTIATKLQVPLELVAQTQTPQSAVEVELTVVLKSGTEKVDVEPTALAEGLAEELGVETHVRVAPESGLQTPAPPTAANDGDDEVDDKDEVDGEGEGDGVVDATPAPTDLNAFSVSGSLVVAVKNAESFVSDLRVKSAVRDALATLTSVPSDLIDVEISVLDEEAARRLRGKSLTPPRRLASSVLITYVIVVSGDALKTVQVTGAKIGEKLHPSKIDDIQSAFSARFEAASIGELFDVSITSIDVPEVDENHVTTASPQTPTPSTPAPTTATDPTPSDPTTPSTPSTNTSANQSTPSPPDSEQSVTLDEDEDESGATGMSGPTLCIAALMVIALLH